MDRKTMGLLVTEALLIVVLVVVIGMDFNKAPAEHGAAPEAAVEEKAADGEEAAAAQEEAAEEKAEAQQEEAAEEKTQAAEVKEEKTARKEKPAEEAKEEKPAEKTAAPVKAEGGAAGDVIALECPAYPHTKGIVQFTHKKHMADYKLNCGECHHDDKGQPLKDLKAGDPVTGCIECHSKPGKAPKPAAGEKMTPEQKREYHVEAMHDNCIECHKEFNKKNNSKAAAVTCAQCHPKK